MAKKNKHKDPSSESDLTTQESMTGEATAYEYSALLKKNRELESKLTQAEEVRQTLALKERTVADLTSASLLLSTKADVLSARADEYKKSLDQTQATLENLQKSTAEQIQAAEKKIEEQERKISRLLSENESTTENLIAQTKIARESEIAMAQSTTKLREYYREGEEKLNQQISNLETRKKTLQTEVDDLKKQAAKTPRWKIGFGAAFFVVGALLLATGVGGAAGLPMVGLGYAAFSVGLLGTVSTFFYGVYKGIKACCAPSVNKGPDPDSDSDSSISDPEDSPKAARVNRTHGRDSGFEIHHSSDRERVQSSTSAGENRYSFHARGDKAPTISFATEQQLNEELRRRKAR